MTDPSERADRDPQVPHVVVTLAGPSAGPGARRVQAPDRVLRIWGLLSATDRELHSCASAKTPETVLGLRQSLLAARADLEQSISAALAAELGHILSPQLASPGPDELRIECASLLGWTGGLVLDMLGQLEAAAEIARSSEPAAPARTQSSRS
jgi:hypothetical protein